MHCAGVEKIATVQVSGGVQVTGQILYGASERKKIGDKKFRDELIGIRPSIVQTAQLISYLEVYTVLTRNSLGMAKW